MRAGDRLLNAAREKQLRRQVQVSPRLAFGYSPAERWRGTMSFPGQLEFEHRPRRRIACGVSRRCSSGVAGRKPSIWRVSGLPQSGQRPGSASVWSCAMPSTLVPPPATGNHSE